MRLLIAAASVFTTSVFGKSACEKSEFYGKTAVVDLCDSHFPDKKSENVWLIEFYAPWCGHCKALKPAFIEAAKKAKKDAQMEGVKFGAVDCTKEQALCQKYGVKGYPTLKTYMGGKTKDYNGQREAADMLSFMKALKETKGTKGGSAKCQSMLAGGVVVPLCSSHFPDKKGKNNWVIVFHQELVAELDNVKEQLGKLAERVTEGGAKLGVVACGEKTSEFCAKQLGEDSTKEAFTVKTFTKGQSGVSTEALAGSDLKSTEKIIHFVKKQLGAKFKTAEVNDEL